MTERTWRDFHAQPGDIITSAGQEKPELWWLVLGSTDDSLIIAYCSPFHRLKTSHFEKRYVQAIDLANGGDGYEIIRREDRLT